MCRTDFWSEKYRCEDSVGFPPTSIIKLVNYNQFFKVGFK
jgi:hypothetical protein